MTDFLIAPDDGDWNYSFFGCVVSCTVVSGGFYWTFVKAQACFNNVQEELTRNLPLLDQRSN